ncbi:MAG TPA: acyl carrier protein [Thermoanaerobaculia bacterium]|nr:acyl carrier protein [Thermoanaerobaculia bacterium]
MKTSEFLELLDEIVEQPPGTLRVDQKLDGMEGWDSLAKVSFIAAVNGQFGITLSADRVVGAKTVADLVALVSPHVSD